MPWYTIDIWSVLIIVGAFQAFFLTISLWFSKENRKNNFLIGSLIFIVGVHLTEYAFAITGLSIEYPHVICTSYPFLFLMGPIYYLYVNYSLNKNFRFKLLYLLHFLPSFLCVIAFIPFYALSSDDKVNYMMSLAKETYISIPIEQFIFMVVHVIQTGIYILFSHRYIGRSEAIIKDSSSNTNILSRVEFIKRFNFYYGLWLAVYFVTLILLVFIKQYRIEIDYVTLLVTSILIYVVGYAALRKPEVFRDVPESDKYIWSDLDKHKVTQIKHSLELSMAESKPYLNSELKLAELAAKINTSPQNLSQVINTEFKQNFYDYINSYRVDEAKKLLLNPGYDNKKILTIGFDVGFNSKATFNRVFKKLTGLTPTEYRNRK
jgi:AraC-like DNA-binding protein